MAVRLQSKPAMDRVCIALVDTTRARFFTFDRRIDELGTHEQLTERADLVNPVRRHRPSELCSKVRPDGGASEDQQYALADHRDHDTGRSDAEFARTAMAALRELIDDDAPERVIVCAGPRMLDKLRASAPGLLPEHLTCDELPRDLVKLSPSELRAELVPHGLLPPRPLHATPTEP